MQLIRSLEEKPFLSFPLVLTIGVFDGLHLGHQLVIEKIEQKKGERGMSALLTFSTHPLLTLHPDQAPFPIISTSQKIALLEKAKIDLLFLLPFTKELSLTPYDLFIKMLHNRFPFSALVLGKEAAFGKNREGNEERLQKIAHELSFTIDYLPKLCIGGDPISSRRIRKALEGGDLALAEQLLGRPYSLFSPLFPCQTEPLTYQALLSDPCLLPTSYYLGEIHAQKEKIPTLFYYEKKSFSLTCYPKDKILVTLPSSLVFFTKLSLSSCSLISKETIMSYL